MIAEIIPLARLPKALNYFDYDVPSNFEGHLKIGQLVEIPFRQKTIIGLVWKIKGNQDVANLTLKPIKKIVDETPDLDKNRLKLLEWLNDYYAAPLPLLTKIFLPSPPRRKNSSRVKYDFPPQNPSVSQKDIDQIKNLLKKFFAYQNSNFLLHYQNAKNKIALYLKIISDLAKRDKQTLILLPQITDIQNTIPYFLHFFPKETGMLHGDMSKTAFWQEWLATKNGERKIVLGTRSAIFAPLSRLGLIIIDDEETTDFKQSDQNPRYDARLATEKLAELAQARIIFASQSPRVETFQKVDENNLVYLREQFSNRKSPVIAIDMNEATKSANYSLFCEELKTRVGECLTNKKKIVLLFNRRGMASLVSCRDCGYTFKCPNCDKPLIFHDGEEGAPAKFLCHHCEREEPIKLICPKCRGASMNFRGAGIQSAEKELKKLFPYAKILRIDKDSSKKEEDNLPDADIYLGTQYFIKNYLPQTKNIGLIGVISIDNLLYRPDFRSAEKIFEWITKIINFAQKINSSIIVQTFFLSHPAVSYALERNYQKFFEQEIEERKNFGYPPFGKLVKLIFRDQDEKKCFFELQRMYKLTTDYLKGKIEITKDEKLQKTNKLFIGKLILKFPESLAKDVLNFVKTTANGWIVDFDPESLL